jgi:uncharacterized protein
MGAVRGTPHLPYPAQIEAYGNGGFRFGGMSHRGSLLFLPSGVSAWPVNTAEELDEATLAPILGLADVDYAIVGTGLLTWAPPEALRWKFRERRLNVDFMTTRPAVRTYNILLAENRRVAAALIAVE